MARSWSVPFISALVALLAVVLVAPQSDPAEGAIPNKGGVYSACLTKSTGALKLVNYPKKTCSKGTKLIRWNAKGQPGAQGIQGIQGPQGGPGPQGPAGPADWNAIGNKPAGFADGVDDIGPSYSSQVLFTSSDFFGPCSNCSASFSVGPLPRNADFLFNVIPTASGGRTRLTQVDQVAEPDGRLRYQVSVAIPNVSAATGFRLRATGFGDGIGPASLNRALRSVKVTGVKVKKLRQR